MDPPEIEYECPACGYPQRASAAFIGQKQKCDNCGVLTTIPEVKPAPPPRLPLPYGIDVSTGEGPAAFVVRYPQPVTISVDDWLDGDRLYMAVEATAGAEMSDSLHVGYDSCSFTEYSTDGEDIYECTLAPTPANVTALEVADLRWLPAARAIADQVGKTEQPVDQLRAVIVETHNAQVARAAEFWRQMKDAASRLGYEPSALPDQVGTSEQQAEEIGAAIPENQRAQANPERPTSGIPLGQTLKSIFGATLGCLPALLWWRLLDCSLGWSVVLAILGMFIGFALTLPGVSSRRVFGMTAAWIVSHNTSHSKCEPVYEWLTDDHPPKVTSPSQSATSSTSTPLPSSKSGGSFFQRLPWWVSGLCGLLVAVLGALSAAHQWKQAFKGTSLNLPSADSAKNLVEHIRKTQELDPIVIGTKVPKVGEQDWVELHLQLRLGRLRKDPHADPTLVRRYEKSLEYWHERKNRQVP
jgi:hypothetical protein